ncbi:F-box protein At4g22280-like isoform X2 [Carex rostrata]
MTDINRCGIDNNFGIDRISSLPNDPRTHILSFLSTREAVQTCILSKRWIKTWASVPDLKFDIKEFGLFEIVNDEMAVQFVTKFELLLRSVLEKRETLSVNRFQLWLDSEFCLPWTQAIADCIDDVMKLEPRECLVKMCSWEKLNLNTNLIFTCASLIYLQLWLSTEVILELESVNLPYLKTLNLGGFPISDNSLKKLMLGCRVLEELVLENCYINNIEICSNTMKKLVLRSFYMGMRLQISLPNLLYLYLDICMEEFILLNMSSLVDASIYIPGCYGKDKYVTGVPKLIDSLSNVENLRLDLDFLRGQVDDKFSYCPFFNNLKRLEILNSRLFVFDLAPYFLHHSPKLQELTLGASSGIFRGGDDSGGTGRCICPAGVPQDR